MVPQSKGLQRLEEQIAHLEPGSLRRQTLEAARRFKSSWIDLGRFLWTVRREKKFRQWGYLSFDAYCVKEIGIRTATATKLLNSYYFLEKEEPATLRRLTEQGPSPRLPSADSVDLLRRLKSRQGIPEEGYSRIRESVLAEGREAPEVRKEIRAAFPSGPGGAAGPDRRKANLKRMVGTLKALRYALTVDEAAPTHLLEEIDSLTRKIEAHLAKP